MTLSIHLHARTCGPGEIPCPECGDPMDERRLSMPNVRATTHGVCSRCIMDPINQTRKVARERAIAAFGEGRC